MHFLLILLHYNIVLFKINRKYTVKFNHTKSLISNIIKIIFFSVLVKTNEVKNLKNTKEMVIFADYLLTEKIFFKYLSNAIFFVFVI